MDVVGTVKATALVAARAASRRRIVVKNNILFMLYAASFAQVMLRVMVDGMRMIGSTD